jgi:hypothetical protein
MGWQKLSDELYRDAVLSNYSHEQLTPLNSFLNNSQILYQDLIEVKNDLNSKSIMLIDKIIDYFALPFQQNQL